MDNVGHNLKWPSFGWRPTELHAYLTVNISSKLPKLAQTVYWTCPWLFFPFYSIYAPKGTCMSKHFFRTFQQSFRKVNICSCFLFNLNNVHTAFCKSSPIHGFLFAEPSQREYGLRWWPLVWSVSSDCSQSFTSVQIRFPSGARWKVPSDVGLGFVFSRVSTTFKNYGDNGNSKSSHVAL